MTLTTKGITKLTAQRTAAGRSLRRYGHATIIMTTVDLAEMG